MRLSDCFYKPLHEQWFAINLKQISNIILYIYTLHTHVYILMTKSIAVTNTVENLNFEWNLNAKLIVFALE